MSVVDKEIETDFDRTKRITKKIKGQIPNLIKNLNYILENEHLLNIEEIQRGTGYITVGCSIIEHALNESDNSH